MTELRACPFCKGTFVGLVIKHGCNRPYFTREGLVLNTPLLYGVRCMDCGGETGAYELAEDARKAWNGGEKV